MQLRTIGDLKKGSVWSHADEKGEKGKGVTSYTGGAKSGMAVEDQEVVKLMEKASLNSKYNLY